MTEGTHPAPDRTGADAADDAAAREGLTPPAAGDLEFDEAWSEPRQGHDVTPERPAREVPAFEDPHDR